MQKAAEGHTGLARRENDGSYRQTSGQDVGRRELGFELKQIKEILGQPDFEVVAALHSHREVLEKNLTHTRRLIETIDNTIQHSPERRALNDRLE